MDVDHHTQRGHAHPHIALANGAGQQRLNLLGYALQRLLHFLGPRPASAWLDDLGLLLFGNRRQIDGRGHTVERLAYLHRIGRGGLAGEGGDHGLRQDLVLAFVERGDRIHHHEKCKQQGDEVGIRHQPPLVVFVFFVGFFTGHDSIRSRSLRQKSGSSALPLPRHLAAMVTEDQPVEVVLHLLIERIELQGVPELAAIGTLFGHQAGKHQRQGNAMTQVDARPQTPPDFERLLAGPAQLARRQRTGPLRRQIAQPAQRRAGHQQQKIDAALQILDGIGAAMFAVVRHSGFVEHEQGAQQGVVVRHDFCAGLWRIEFFHPVERKHAIELHRCHSAVQRVGVAGEKPGIREISGLVGLGHDVLLAVHCPIAAIVGPIRVATEGGSGRGLLHALMPGVAQRRDHGAAVFDGLQVVENIGLRQTGQQVGINALQAFGHRLFGKLRALLRTIRQHGQQVLNQLVSAPERLPLERQILAVRVAQRGLCPPQVFENAVQPEGVELVSGDALIFYLAIGAHGKSGCTHETLLMGRRSAAGRTGTGAGTAARRIEERGEVLPHRLQLRDLRLHGVELLLQQCGL